MRRLMPFVVAMSIALLPAFAHADLVDFVVRINNTPLGPTDQLSRLAGVVNWENVQLATRGSITIRFKADNLSRTTAVFDGTATINSGQTQVTTGNLNNGRIVLTYDPSIDRLEAHFVINLRELPGYTYSLEAEDSIHSWIGRSTIMSVFPQ